MTCAQVAQLVEQRTENPRVGGSIPPLGTIPLRNLYINIDFLDLTSKYDFMNDLL